MQILKILPKEFIFYFLNKLIKNKINNKMCKDFLISSEQDRAENISERIKINWNIKSLKNETKTIIIK